jgi:hypothetical protein
LDGPEFSSGPPEYDLTRTGCDAKLEDLPLLAEVLAVWRAFQDKGLGVPFKWRSAVVR